MEKAGLPATEGDRKSDLHGFLTRTIAAVSEDQAQLRHLVYETARRSLRRHLHRQFEDGDWAGIQEQIQALETAIDQVEFRLRQYGFFPSP